MKSPGGSYQSVKNLSKKQRLEANRLGIKRSTFKPGEEPLNAYYVRYADDFLIGLQGKRETAKEVLKAVTLFISSDLHLSTSRTELTHARTS